MGLFNNPNMTNIAQVIYNLQLKRTLFTYTS